MKCCLKDYNLLILLYLCLLILIFFIVIYATIILKTSVLKNFQHLTTNKFHLLRLFCKFRNTSNAYLFRNSTSGIRWPLGRWAYSFQFVYFLIFIAIHHSYSSHTQVLGKTLLNIYYRNLFLSLYESSGNL